MSVGISLSSRETEPDVLIRAADRAIHAAKRHGKNTSAFTASEMSSADVAGRDA